MYLEDNKTFLKKTNYVMCYPGRPHCHLINDTFVTFSNGRLSHVVNVINDDSRLLKTFSKEAHKLWAKLIHKTWSSFYKKRSRTAWWICHRKSFISNLCWVPFYFQPSYIAAKRGRVCFRIFKVNTVEEFANDLIIFAAKTLVML